MQKKPTQFHAAAFRPWLIIIRILFYFLSLPVWQMDSLPSRMWGTAIMMLREDEADVSPLVGMQIPPPWRNGAVRDSPKSIKMFKKCFFCLYLISTNLWTYCLYLRILFKFADFGEYCTAKKRWVVWNSSRLVFLQHATKYCTAQHADMTWRKSYHFWEIKSRITQAAVFERKKK